MSQRKLSQLAETLIGSEIVKLGGEIREKIRQGQKIYNFTVGDFDPAIFPIPVELEEAIIEAYRNHCTNYPAAEGNLDLRQAISSFILEHEQLDYSVNEILVSCGGRPLIYSIFRVICDKGDKVVYAVPSWNNNHYTHFVEAEHVVVQAGPESDFMPLAENLRPHLHEATLLALCSPQNPTGTVFQGSELEKICDLVLEENARRQPHEKKLYVLYDQMYWHLTFGDTQHVNPVTLRPEMRDYTIFVDAISKVFASTGLRVGWSLGPADIMDKMKAVMSHLGAWAPMAEQKGTAKFLGMKDAIRTYLLDFKTKIEQRLVSIYDGFQLLKEEGFNVDAIYPKGAIYLTIKVDITGKTTFEGKLLETQDDVTGYLLDEARLAVVPFYAFGAPRNSAWYRLSIGTCKLEEINEMIGELKSALQKLR
jgi:aspartate aminotransferase